MSTPSSSAARLYVSYAPDGAKYAAKLAEHLRDDGIAVALGPDPSNGIEMDTLRRRMDGSAALLIVMTTAAGTAGQVIEEFDRAERAGKPILGLLLEGRRPGFLNQYPYENVTRGQLPTAEFVDEVRLALGLPAGSGPKPPPPDRRRILMVTGAAVLVLAIAGGASWFATSLGKPPVGPTTQAGATGQPASDAPSTSPGGAAVAPLAPGKVAITSHHDGDAVDRCVHISGTANLDPGKTILFAKMRTSPSDNMWYFGWVGSYRNGFVPGQWTGSEYLGSEVGQHYDVFVIVMDVAAADTFWKAHASKDDSSAFAPAVPPDAERAAVVRLVQGTTDDCK